METRGQRAEEREGERGWEREERVGGGWGS